LNEDANGLLRRYWSKATDFQKVKQKEVTPVIVQLNHQLRKKMRYKTPVKLMKKHMATISA
jgi:IS30 family transposase